MNTTESYMEALMSMPKDPSYKEIEGFMIPRKKSVIIKMLKHGTQETESGILLSPNAANTQRPNIGVIYAFGPEVTDLVPGLRCYINQYCDLEINVKGESYIMCSEVDVYGIIPPKSWVYLPPKKSDQVRREKKHSEQDSYIIRKHNADQNEKDKKHDKTKGKIRPVK